MIAPLDTATVRLLGSTTGVSEPLDLVKELIENAIDAGARSIEISVSPNTLDRIQVRDDGTGIALKDFEALGRPAHTSKLTTFDELHVRGGATLGFRGQALASANTVGQVSIITKTVCEPVASRIKLSVGGGVKERCPVSATVGTTLQVVDLFGNVPVRKQQLLKKAADTIDKIKALVKAYVFARRSVKFKFKLLGSPKSEWMYVPSVDASLKDVTLQLFGKVVANGCVVMEEKGAMFELEAFLPREHADWVKGKTQFISVDGRPMAAGFGTMKKIVGMVKERLGGKGFMVLRVSCRPGAYDVNVAAAKNEVLFGDEGALLEGVERLLDRVYGTAEEMEHQVGEHQRVEEGGCPAPAEQDLQARVRNGFTAVNKSLPIRRQQSIPAPVTEKLTTSVKMRTTAVVNMERQDSDITDDGQFIELEIPARKVQEGVQEPRKKKPRLTDAAKKFLGIEHYFQPTQLDFDIATDITATPDHSHKQPTKSQKLPLNPLSDAQVNRMQEQIPDWNLSDDESVTELDTRTPAPRVSRDAHVPRESIESVISPPPTEQRRLPEVTRPSALDWLPSLQTPPPSAPFNTIGSQVLGNRARRTAAQRQVGSPAANRRRAILGFASPPGIQSQLATGQRRLLLGRTNQRQTSNSLGPEGRRRKSQIYN